MARTIISIMASKTYQQTPGYSPGLFLSRVGITQAWVQRKISNFEYLLRLNTFAGTVHECCELKLSTLN